MKRIIVFLLLAGLMIAPACAQFYPFSLENGLTAGTFFNELDQSFQVTADFGAYTHSLLFAGLGNPSSGLSPYSQERAWDTSLFNNTLRAGYYMLKPAPISLYTHMQMSRLLNRGNPGVSITDSWESHGIDADGNSEQWSQGTTTKKTPGLPVLRDYDLGFQTIMKLGPGVLGFYLGAAADNSKTDVANAPGYFGDTVKIIRDNNALSGEALNVREDHTVTEKYKNYNLPGSVGVYSTKNTFSLLVPFAIRTGKIEQRFHADFGLDIKDNSYEFSQVESAHRYIAGAAINPDREGSGKDIASLFDIDLGYGLIIPTGERGDTWKLGALLGLSVGNTKFLSDSTTRNYDLRALNAKTALSGGSVSIEHVRKATMYMDINLNASRLFNLKPATGVQFHLQPGAGLKFATGQVDELGNPLYGSEANLTKTTTTKLLDASGNVAGSYDVAYNVSSGKDRNRTIIGMEIESPMGLVLKPEGWKFGLLLGANPRVGFNVTAETAKSIQNKMYTDTVSSSGNVTHGPYTVTQASPSVTTWTFVPSLSENHYIGISIPFPGGVRLDARLNGNLLEFENFAVQAVIPLDF